MIDLSKYFSKKIDMGVLFNMGSSDSSLTQTCYGRRRYHSNSSPSINATKRQEVNQVIQGNS